MKPEDISSERAFEIVRFPQISEKATFVADKDRQIIFRVASNASKREIKAAIELLWKPQDIQVDKVQTLNVKGKKKGFGRFFGRRDNWKKAYVTLKGEKEIDFTDARFFEDK